MTALVTAIICPGVQVQNSTQFGGRYEFADDALTVLPPMT
jgi:hypothetical protein